MPLRQLSYRKLEPLLRDHLNIEEDKATQMLLGELKVAKSRGYLTKTELKKICKWKSPRAIKLIEQNPENRTQSITKEAFANRSEKKKIALLTTLTGVSLPMASAILTLTNPKRYGVIDIRAWQLLFDLGVMRTNQKGVSFKFNEWYRFLMIIRYFAKKFKVDARDIERTLFLVHRKYQQGKLYEGSSASKNKSQKIN